MRTALLAAYRKSPQGTLRASLVLAGRQVLAWQVNAAQALGCERVVVLSDAPGEALAEAERAARTQGMAFQRLARFAELAALLRAEDELLLLADGMLPDKAVLAALLAPAGTDKPLRKHVLCVPVDDPQATAFPEDFERIDAVRCWAGAAVMRAAPTQHLGDFPADSNAHSLLLRMALQAGTPCHTLAPDERAASRWVLAHDESALAAHETGLLRQYRSPGQWSAPGAALAQTLAGQIPPRSLAAAAQGANLGGIALLVAAIAAAAWGWPLAALVAALLGSLALDLGANLGRVVHAVLGAKPVLATARLHDPGRDVLTAGVLIAALGYGGQGALAALGPLALGTARLAAASAPPLAAAFWQDRTAQLALLALGAAFGMLAQTTALLALGALAQALFAKRTPAIP